ncbi:hypothetical protein PIB30_070365 [Stylosanthes scabra]|uniref:Uncharacterized protein n=1 Tax=Stylosanthes scabra TaxID=79078 RepID=A0ABU6SP09_9FABA|nr:hypothetical protein [Stylosanthes scabra]
MNKNNNGSYSKISASTTKSRSIDFSSDSFPTHTPNPTGGERFGVILGRSGSVSSATSSYGGGFLKKAFSIRRSSSVSERYCRIHDQYMAITSPDNNNDEIIITRSVKTKNKHSSYNNGRGGSKIFKACKRILGF